MPEGFEYSRSFFRRYYRPENCVLLLAGDFDRKTAAELVRKYYSGWATGYSAPEIQPEPPQQSERRAQVDFPGRTLPVLTVSHKGPAWSAVDRISVATTVLGEAAFGRNSELYRKLVLRDQTVQMLRGDFSLQRDPYLLSVTAMVPSPSNIELVESEILATAAHFRDNRIEEARLDQVKRALRYGFLMGLETAQSVAFSLLGPVVNTGTLEAVEEYYRTLDALTAEDVQEAARRYLVQEGRTVLTLMPKTE
jgi:zinc protease